MNSRQDAEHEVRRALGDYADAGMDQLLIASFPSAPRNGDLDSDPHVMGIEDMSAPRDGDLVNFGPRWPRSSGSAPRGGGASLHGGDA